MSRLASLLHIPEWLERAWQDSVIDPEDPAPQPPDPREAETVPMPLYGGLVPRQ